MYYSQFHSFTDTEHDNGLEFCLMLRLQVIRHYVLNGADVAGNGEGYVQSCMYSMHGRGKQQQQKQNKKKPTKKPKKNH